MKKNLLFLLIVFSSVAYGQVPNQINYQGVARNSVGNVLPNKNISVRLSVHDGSATGAVVYREVRNVTTSNFGLFNIAIGSAGSVSVTGTIAGINWKTGAKYLQVEVDPGGGSNFMDLGAAQLLSVPYALFSGNALNASPSGNAGGDLSGVYPDPTIATGAVNTSKLADNSVTTPKIADASVTSAKLAAGVIPTSLPPNGSAGGDLFGTYPNPTIAASAVTTIKLADNSVTTSKIVDASVTAAKLAAGLIPTSLPPNGSAGGDLSGTYPNPSLNKIQGIALNATSPTNGQVLKFNGTQWVPSVDNVGSGGNPTGPAGGDLTGTYPNPNLAAAVVTTTKLADNSVTTAKIVDASVTAAKLAAGVIPTSLPPNGSAGGDLSGAYPNPTIATNAVTTTKIADASVTAAKLAAGVIPTSLPPNGSAGGDLSGTYPNPSLSKIQGIALNATSPTNGQVLKFNGTQWVPSTDNVASGGSPTGPAGGDLSGTYPDPTIATNAVTTIKLADNSVTTSKIVDASVTAAKLAAGVIPTSLPPNGSAGGDLTGTYPNPTIATNTVTTIKLADNSVTTSKIVDASVTAAKLAAGVIPTTLPPNGLAGGDLSGTYPNPSVNKIQGISINNTAPTTGQVLKFDGVQWAPGIDNGGSGGNPTGPAGGDLNGTYPDPNIRPQAVITNKIANGAVTNAKLASDAVTTINILDGSVTSSKLAAGVIPSSLPPSGSAGGDLSGSYPNPTVNKILGVAVTTTGATAGQVLKYNGSQWVPGTDNVGSGGGAPTGPAGGDLSGTYPDPTIATAAVTTTKLADNSVTTSKIVDASVTAAKLAAGVIPTSLPPNGSAGGDLTGTYPNPTITTGAVTTTKLADNSVTTSKIVDASVTAAKLAAGVIPTSLPPNGTAGGDLTGSYPDPTITTGAVTTTKLADNSVTTSKIVDASVTAAKLAAGVIPTSLPPNGSAGGDLSGTYPNPSVNKIQGVIVNNAAPTNGQVLKFNGTQWAPAADNTGFTLPYSSTTANASNLISVTNTSTGAGLEGINSSTNANAFGVIGKITSTTPGGSSAAVRAINSGTNSQGTGLWASHGGSGIGVYGTSVSGTGVQGNSTNYTGVFGTSNNYVSGWFDISNSSNSSDALVAYTTGTGNGINSLSEQGNGIWGITLSPSSAGIYGINAGGGEAIVGQSYGTTAAVVGKNSADGGTGLMGLANADGTNNGTALVAKLESGNGDLAVFKVGTANKARIDDTGKGYFNGGTQNSGADLAEAFDVEGNRKDYEPGDVLVISQISDRKVEKSSSPYSTLVAGVFATKPGVLLTEKNAEQNQLDQMVAMGVVGVIPTKVCLEGGAIKRGDLIVTSSLSGVAMKADPDKVRVGQVIGKALQDYNTEGVGKINVLVSIK